MVEVEKLCKKILFIINLRRIKQITRDKCSSKGGLQPPQPLPWIRLCYRVSDAAARAKWLHSLIHKASINKHLSGFLHKISASRVRVAKTMRGVLRKHSMKADSIEEVGLPPCNTCKKTSAGFPRLNMNV